MVYELYLVFYSVLRRPVSLAAPLIELKLPTGVHYVVTLSSASYITSLHCSLDRELVYYAIRMASPCKHFLC